MHRRSFNPALALRFFSALCALIACKVCVPARDAPGDPPGCGADSIPSIYSLSYSFSPAPFLLSRSFCFLRTRLESFHSVLVRSRSSCLRERKFAAEIKSSRTLASEDLRGTTVVDLLCTPRGKKIILFRQHNYYFFI